jgi:Tol biopolymer transport system component
MVAGAWFHDNTMLVSALRDDGQRWLYRLDPATRKFTEIVAFEADGGGNGLTTGFDYMQQSHPVSPDGRIIYMVERDRREYNGGSRTDPRFNRIVAFDIGSGQRRRVFTSLVDGDIRHIQLSPDGQRLAMVIQGRLNSLTTQVAVVAIDGTGYQVIGNGPDARNSGYSVAWTRDGRNVLFSTPTAGMANDWQVMSVAAAGGSTPTFTGVDVKHSDRMLIAVSPDGSRLAFSGTSTAKEFWALDNVLSALR